MKDAGDGIGMPSDPESPYGHWLEPGWGATSNVWVFPEVDVSCVRCGGSEVHDPRDVCTEVFDRCCLAAKKCFDCPDRGESKCLNV